MTPVIITLSLLILSQQGRKTSGIDFGMGYRGTVCGFHTQPFLKYPKCNPLLTKNVTETNQNIKSLVNLLD